MPTREILKKLGTIKNQLFIFTIISSLIISGFAAPLAHSGPEWKQICGVTMHFITIVMLIAAFTFYVYAFFNLPSSTQELEFSNVATKQLTEHEYKISPKREGSGGE